MPPDSEELTLILLCTRIAAVAGRSKDAQRFLRDAFSRGLDAASIRLIAPDLNAIRNDPLVRRTEKM
jgi:hypothetical protein